MASSHASQKSGGSSKKSGGWGIKMPKAPKLPKALRIGGSSSKSKAPSESDHAAPPRTEKVEYDNEELRKNVKPPSSKGSSGIKMPKWKVPKALKFGSSSTRSETKTNRKAKLQEIKQEAKERKSEHKKASSLAEYKKSFIKQNELLNDDICLMLERSTQNLQDIFTVVTNEKIALAAPLETLDNDFSQLLEDLGRSHIAIRKAMDDGLSETYELVGDHTKEHSTAGRSIRVGKTGSFYRPPQLTNDYLSQLTESKMVWIETNLDDIGLKWGTVAWLQSWYSDMLKYLAIDLTIQRLRFERGIIEQSEWETILDRILRRGRWGIERRFSYFKKCRELTVANEYYNATRQHFIDNI